MDRNLDKLIRSRAKLLRRTDDVQRILKFSELSIHDQAALELRYGQQPRPGNILPCPRPIEEIRTLTAYERDIFEGQDLVTPEFCLQLLYKVHGEYLWDGFRENIRQMFREIPDLRVNFFPLGIDQKMHKVVFVERTADIKFLSLNCLTGQSLDSALRTLMTIDQRQAFDLEDDVLMRITVVHTAKMEYAVLLTESRLIANAWKPQEFLHAAWQPYSDIASYEMPVQDEPMEEREEAEASDEGRMEAEDDAEAAAPKYWQGLMENLPPVPKLPGFRQYVVQYRPMRHSEQLAPKDRSLLLERAQGSKALLITILHTAWGFLIRRVNYYRETYYCLLLPDTALDLGNASEKAGIVCPIPIRLACENKLLVKNIIGRQMKQMLTSREVPTRHMRDMLENLGQTRDTFPFFLHFHNFLHNKESYSSVDAAQNNFSLVDFGSWDADKRDLSLHFDMDQDGIYFTIAYNLYCFESYSIEPLARYFKLALHHMLHAWNQPFPAFEQELKRLLSGWTIALNGVAYDPDEVADPEPRVDKT